MVFFVFLLFLVISPYVTFGYFKLIGKHENLGLCNMGGMEIVPSMEKVTQVSQKLDGVLMEVLIKGGNKDVGQGNKTW